MISCKPCSGGSFCPPGAASELPCPAGSFSDTPSLAQSDDCTACPAGSLCSTGSTAPTPCSPGTFTNVIGQSECRLCTPGTYQANSGATHCNICGAGNYSSNILSCEPCALGEYCDLGVSFGKRCPAGFTTNGRGAASKDDCGCYDGMYEKRLADGNRTCIECPTGTLCNNANTKLEALPVAPGHWRQGRASEEVRPCFTEAACLGGKEAISAPNVSCALSQQGPYCAVCADGYFGGGDGLRSLSGRSSVKSRIVNRCDTS